MTEIGGQAAIYIEPNNPEQATEIIADHLPNLGILKSQGIVNARRFTAEKMVLEYTALYQKTIREKCHEKSRK